MHNSRIPQLAFPFALVGAAAGWLCVGLLSHPLVGWFPERPQALAAAVATVAGAIVGAIVTRGARPREADAWRSRWSPGAITLIAVPVAGAVTGAIVSLAVWTKPAALLAGAGPGAACGIAFLPICAVVLAAARRSERARLGSIVAASDHRAVWRTLGGCMAAASLLAAPDWAAAANGVERAPAPGAAIAVAAALIVAALLAGDARAVARVAALERRGSSMEERPPGGADADDAAVPRVDLGLGAGVRADVTRGAAYRSASRATALLLGDPGEALGALRGARRRSAAVLGVAGAAIALHAAAMSPRAAIAFAESRCADDLTSGCVRAAELHAERRDLRQALAFRSFACDHRHAASCTAARELRAALGIATPHELYEASCEEGDTASCRAVARLLLRKPQLAPGSRDQAMALLRRACVRGDDAGCEELDHLSRQPN